MSPEMNRRTFLKGSLAASAAGALGAYAAGQGAALGAEGAAKAPPAAKAALPLGKIGKLQVSRLLLGGNLLTHYTHSRDLRYVYTLTAHYNTPAKIMETMALAEAHGINTLVVHTVPAILKTLQEYREKKGGKIQWIICPTANFTDDMKEYSRQVQELADMGCDAIYVWGVRSDGLTGANVSKIAKAVEIAKDHALPSGVGAHDLRVVEDCEKAKVPADFYIKTFHHHSYGSAPRPDQLGGPTGECPGYWCKDPKQTIEVMKTVTKPWIAFKVMAAGAIPPANAFQYVLSNGADHVLAGMFDFEIAEDAAIARKILAATTTRERPWCS